MRTLVLILISTVLFVSSTAFAASYEQISGTIIDPIRNRLGGFHPYVGNNLEPGANLNSADLFYANLGNANLASAFLPFANLANAYLYNADLLGAILGEADLSGADLTTADLTYAYLGNADLTNADLSGAILANAVGLSSSSGAALYDINTDFTGTGFDPVAAGWTLVPEPSAALLTGLGLAGLAARRR